MIKLNTYEVAVRETIVYYLTIVAESDQKAKQAAEDAIVNSDDPVHEFQNQLLTRESAIVSSHSCHGA